MKMFQSADEDNNGSLTISEVKVLLRDCVQAGKFNSFFQEDDDNLRQYAQKLFEDIFEYVYEDEDDGELDHIDEQTFV